MYQKLFVKKRKRCRDRNHSTEEYFRNLLERFENMEVYIMLKETRSKT